MTTKRIVLFITENRNVTAAISAALSKLYGKEKYHVEFISFSLESAIRKLSDSTDISPEISNCINSYLLKNKGIYTARDIEEIIHLIDLNGSHVTIDKIRNLSPELQRDDYVDLPRINAFKKPAIDALVKIKHIRVSIPYKPYYFSRNIAHVFVNKPMAILDMKTSEIIDSVYGNNSISFVEFINNIECIAPGNYDETWEFIKQGINSYERYTNFHLLVNSTPFAQTYNTP